MSEHWFCAVSSAALRGALAGAALFVSGCSLIFVKGPPASGQRVQAPGGKFACTTSRAAPIIDSAVTAFQLIRTAVALSNDESDYRNYPISREADIAFGVGFTALFLGSAIHGFNKTSACQRALGPSERQAPELDREDEPLTFSTPGEEAPRKPRLIGLTPPTGIAGFELGVTEPQAREVCEKAGQTWEKVGDESYRCSGAPEPVGAPARTELTFCGTSLCRVALVISPEAERGPATQALRRSRGQLHERYGLPTSENYSIATLCKAAQTIEECLELRGVEAFSKWQFSSGHELSLQLEVARVEGAPPKAVLRLGYKAPLADMPKPVGAAAGGVPAPPPEPASPPTCVPGQTIACAGPKGCTGRQVCAAGGRHYEACSCD